MSEQQLNDQLTQLRTALKENDALSEQTSQLLHQLEDEITASLNTNDNQETSLTDTAALLESRFATEHPTAEALMRNIIDTLAKMGI